MPSIHALYNQEVLEGHREALAVLRELLATEPDRLERRRLANAILKTRKVQDPEEPRETTEDRAAGNQRPQRRAVVSTSPSDRAPTGREGDTRPPTNSATPLHTKPPCEAATGGAAGRQNPQRRGVASSSPSPTPHAEPTPQREAA